MTIKVIGFDQIPCNVGLFIDPATNYIAQTLHPAFTYLCPLFQDPAASAPAVEPRRGSFIRFKESEA